MSLDNLSKAARWSFWTIAFAAASCAAQVPTEASVAGKHWVARMPEVEDAKQRPRLEFVRDGRLAGYTGCNMIAGKWRLEGSEIRLDALAATKRACLGPGGEVEKRFLAAVNASSRVSLEGAALVVQGSGGERLAFIESPSNP
jgi:heat shock protein HslJ